MRNAGLWSMASQHVLTPPPTPSPDSKSSSLADSINTATRTIHSSLNKLIIDRLSLALPPHTSNPSLYTSGLLHILPIYQTFESLWKKHIDTSGRSASVQYMPPGESSKPAFAATLRDPATRVFALLSHLRLPGLLRAGRLRDDIRKLTDSTDEMIDASVASICSSGPLADFIAAITTSIQARPHVLVAYAWVLYMALFSGGRYIRASLHNAGGQRGDFWERELSPVRPYATKLGLHDFTSSSNDLSSLESTQKCSRRPSMSRAVSAMPIGVSIRTSARAQARSSPGADVDDMDGRFGQTPLQFYEFIGNEDGEDIKREFKKRLVEAEIMLSDSEKSDIIDASITIFEGLHRIINVLDEIRGEEHKGSESGNRRMSLADELGGKSTSGSTSEEVLTEDAGIYGDLSSAPDTPPRRNMLGRNLLAHRSLPAARDSISIARLRSTRSQRSPAAESNIAATDTERDVLSQFDKRKSESSQPPEDCSNRPRSDSYLSGVTNKIGKLVRFNTGAISGCGDIPSVDDPMSGTVLNLQPKHGLILSGVVVLFATWLVVGITRRNASI